MSVNELVKELEARHTRHALADAKRNRLDHPRASSIGMCAREIYHSMVDWQQRPAPDAWMMQRFGRGHVTERFVISDMMAQGWEVVESQLPFEIREDYKGQSIVICTGHVDGRIVWNGAKPVFDVKSLHPNVFQSIDSVQDFHDLGSFWLKYPRQLALYLYANNEAEGLFILDDCMGHRKYLPMKLDDWLDECEDALQTARTAEIAKLEGKPPPHIDDPSVCAKCWARETGVCFPPMDFSTDGTQHVGDGQLADDVEWLVENEGVLSEFKAREKRVKASFKEMPAGEYLCGGAVVTHKVANYTHYAIPADIKKQYAEKREQHRISWKPLVVKD